MKNILVFFFISLFVFVFPVSAQYEAEVVQDASSAATFTPDERVQYELAYPGILPDHPLYFLKATRDRLVSVLINDTQKRAEFNLLTADKRMYAGVFLIKKDKDELAISTMSKGSNYFQEAFDQVQVMKKASKPTHDITNRLLTASQKYQEVYAELESEIDEPFRNSFKKEQERIRKYIKEVPLLEEKAEK